MEPVTKRDALRRMILHEVEADRNPFASLAADIRSIGSQLAYLTWHGYVTEHLEDPSGRTRQLGPEQGSLFCCWPGHRL